MGPGRRGCRGGGTGDPGRCRCPQCSPAVGGGYGGDRSPTACTRDPPLWCSVPAAAGQLCLARLPAAVIRLRWGMGGRRRCRPHTVGLPGRCGVWTPGPREGPPWLIHTLVTQSCPVHPGATGATGAAPRGRVGAMRPMWATGVAGRRSVVGAVVDAVMLRPAAVRLTNAAVVPRVGTLLVPVVVIAGPRLRTAAVQLHTTGLT